METNTTFWLKNNTTVSPSFTDRLRILFGRKIHVSIEISVDREVNVIETKAKGSIETFFPPFITKNTQKVQMANIPFKCPYQKFACTEYDSSSATLMVECKNCPNYNNGIVASKF